jgi:hypothetical protein
LKAALDANELKLNTHHTMKLVGAAKGALEGRSLGWNHSDPIEPGSVDAIQAFNEFAKTQATAGQTS